MNFIQQLTEANNGNSKAIEQIEQIDLEKLKKIIVSQTDLFEQIKKTSDSNWSAFFLGVMYEHGIGIDKNLEEAKKMYNISALCNNSNAFNNLAYLCDNKKEMINYFEKSVSLGNVVAMYNLACLHFEPYTKISKFRSTTKQVHDPNSGLDKARKLFEQAANKGYVDAMYSLGWMYSGIGKSKPDYIKAIEWYQKAADKGDSNAMYAIGRMHELGKGTAINKKKAEELYNKAIKFDNSDAMHALGRLFHENKKYEDALKWYNKAITYENGDALHDLAMLYEFGKGVGKDHKKAMELLKRSAATRNENGIDSYILFLKIDRDFINLAVFHLEQGNETGFLTTFEDAIKSNTFGVKNLAHNKLIDDIYGNEIPEIVKKCRE